MIPEVRLLTLKRVIRISGKYPPSSPPSVIHTHLEQGRAEEALGSVMVKSGGLSFHRSRSPLSLPQTRARTPPFSPPVHSRLSFSPALKALETQTPSPRGSESRAHTPAAQDEDRDFIASLRQGLQGSGSGSRAVVTIPAEVRRLCGLCHT